MLAGLLLPSWVSIWKTKELCSTKVNEIVLNFTRIIIDLAVLRLTNKVWVSHIPDVGSGDPCYQPTAKFLSFFLSTKKDVMHIVTILATFHSQTITLKNVCNIFVKSPLRIFETHVIKVIG